MESTATQQAFFHHIKGLLPPHISFVDEIAEILTISNDSAYRRIRGEKEITLEEVKKLCVRFKISLDKFLHLQSDSVIFTGKLAHVETFNFEKYLEDFLHQLDMINSFNEKELYYLPKDVPIFHHYNFPELAAFKYFFWMKTVLEYPEYAKAVFDLSSLPEKLLRTGEKILESYNKIPSQEVWNVENINGTLRQIEYYNDTNVFTTKKDVEIIFECVQKMMDHIEAQAEAGYKINQPGKGQNPGASYKLYVNEFIISDNTVMPILNGKRIVYLSHSFINYSSTTDSGFCDYIYNYIQRIIRKSSLVSIVNEKQRKNFFNTVRGNITRRKNAALQKW